MLPACGLRRRGHRCRPGLLSDPRRSGQRALRRQPVVRGARRNQPQHPRGRRYHRRGRRPRAVRDRSRGRLQRRVLLQPRGGPERRRRRAGPRVGDRTLQRSPAHGRRGFRRHVLPLRSIPLADPRLRAVYRKRQRDRRELRQARGRPVRLDGLLLPPARGGHAPLDRRRRQHVGQQPGGQLVAGRVAARLLGRGPRHLRRYGRRRAARRDPRHGHPRLGPHS